MLTNINLETGIRYAAIGANRVNSEALDVLGSNWTNTTEEAALEEAKTAFYGAIEETVNFALESGKESDGTMARAAILEDLTSRLKREHLDTYAADIAIELYPILLCTCLDGECSACTFDGDISRLIEEFKAADLFETSGTQQHWFDRYESSGDHYSFDDGEYKIDYDGNNNDVAVVKSPFYTFAPLASPCFPNGTYLSDGSGSAAEGYKCYALGFDYFDEQCTAPYRFIWSVESDDMHARPLQYAVTWMATDKGDETVARVNFKRDESLPIIINQVVLCFHELESGKLAPNSAIDLDDCTEVESRSIDWYKSKQVDEYLEQLQRDVTSAAQHTAALFVDEFNEALDPADTDWDGSAWEADRRAFDKQFCDLMFPLYQAALVAETARLVCG